MASTLILIDPDLNLVCRGAGMGRGRATLLEAQGRRVKVAPERSGHRGDATDPRTGPVVEAGAVARMPARLADTMRDAEIPVAKRRDRPGDPGRTRPAPPGAGVIRRLGPSAQAPRPRAIVRQWEDAS